MSEFNLDREISINNSVDATGKKWMIHMNKHNGLCFARPEPDRTDAVIPKDLEGVWTKPSMLQTRIEAYLNQTWDKAEAATAAAERKRQATAEQAKSKAKDGTANK
jgi:hypothetical protein